ncbi:TonB-dependent siderophore receptor [Aliarcobacter lanthieri]|uniref:TonB-dependent siderophore receptor n=1 Tax=Aliarcobacter lanthieri TaxID=1355374 RepID=UPI0004B100B5|nr:TonB-dependent siderophore receptor [Aliarcobacter lanthieri]
MKIKMAKTVATALLVCSAGVTLSNAEETTTKLDAITVSETKTNSPATSYTVKETSSSTKLDLSLKQTPQSISVITQKQIEDQNLQNINDVLAQTPGVTTIQYGQMGAGYTSYYARGMKITNFQRDGIPTTSFGDFTGVESSDIYESIQVTRGSTGLTNGSGNPAASINYIRKKPTKEFQGNAKVSYGSWDTYKGTIDISGGLNSNDSIRGRLVASYGEGESQQDRYKQENSLIYGALDFDLSDNTLLTTSLIYQKTNIDNATAHGFPFITTDGKKQTIFNRYDNPAADYTYSDTEKLNLSLGIEHYFNDDWKAIANYSYTKAKNDRVYGVAGSGGIWNNTGLMRVTSGRFESTPETHAIDLYTTGNIKAFNREHKLSFGVNGYQTKSDDPSYGRVFDNVNISGWNGKVPNLTPITKNGKTVVDIKEIGAFAALNLELSDPLHLIVGARVTNFERVNNKGTTTEQEQKYNAEFIPYVGLIYDINENFATYASYTSIFNPTSTNEDANGKYLDPEEGNTVEFGLKSEFYDGRLNTSIAYYLTKQDNLAIIDPSYPIGYLNPNGKTPNTTVDGAKIKGWDLTIGGEILPNWNISGGYTYTQAKDRNEKPLNTDIPKHSLKIFSSYQYNKLTFGGGINWQSEIYNSSVTGLASELQRQKSYTIVNAMAKYDIKKDFSVILNANNLFDEEYVLNTSNGAWGAERNYTLSLNYKF